MKYYTRKQFFLDLEKHRPIVLVRKGTFVGLFRVDGNSLRLWRRINQESYGFIRRIELQDKGRYWGHGGFAGPSVLTDGYDAVNEMHFVPREIPLSRVAELAKCLGGAHCQVRERILRLAKRAKTERLKRMNVYTQDSRLRIGLQTIAWSLRDSAAIRVDQVFWQLGAEDCRKIASWFDREAVRLDGLEE